MPSPSDSFPNLNIGSVSGRDGAQVVAGIVHGNVIFSGTEHSKGSSPSPKFIDIRISIARRS